MQETIKALEERKHQLAIEIELLNAQLNDKETELEEIGGKIDLLLNRSRCKLCNAYIIGKQKQITVSTCDSVSRTVKLMRFKVCNKCFDGLIFQ